MAKPNAQQSATRGSPLQRFILLRLLLIMILPMLAVASINLWFASQQLEQKARQQFEQQAEQNAKLLQRWLNMRLADARLYAHGAGLDVITQRLVDHWQKTQLSAPEFIATPLWQSIHKAYQQRTEALSLHDQLFHNLLLISRDGTVLLSARPTPLLGQNLLRDPVSPALRRTVENTLTDDLDHLSSAQPLDGGFSSWYVDDLGKSGLVALQLNFSQLKSFVAPIDGELRQLIINQKGELRTSLPAFSNSTSSGQPRKALTIAFNDQDLQRYRSFDGVDVVGIRHAVTAADQTWYLLSETPASRLLDAAKRLWHTIALYIAAAALLSIIAAALLARHLAAPIQRLSQPETSILAEPGSAIIELEQIRQELKNNIERQQQQQDLINDSLLKSHQHLAQLSDQKEVLDQHCIILLVGSDGRIKTANKHFCRLTGYQPEELIDKPLAELEPEPFGASGWHINRALQQGQSWTGVVHGHDRAQQSFWLQATVIPLRRDQGTMYVCTDISVQQRTQQVLTELHQITSDTSLNLEQRINAILELGCRVFELPIGIVSDIRSNTYTVRYVQAPEGALSSGDQFTLGDTYCVHTLMANAPVAYHHAGHSDIAEHPCYQNFKLESYVGSPLFIQGQRRGTVNFSGPEPRSQPFSAQELELVQLLSQWVGQEIGRDHNQQTLQRQGRLLQQVSRQARIGAWEVNLIDQEVHWSEMTRIIHRVPDDFVPTIEKGIEFYKEGASRNRIQAAIQLAIEQGTPWDETLQIVTYDGHEIWVQARGQAEFQHDRCVRLFGSFQDVNEQLLEQHRNELVLRSTAVGVWDWQLDSGKTQFNERWAEIVGYSLAELEPTTIDTWMSLAHPDDLAESERLLQQHWQGETEYYVCEARMRHKDGHWIWVLDTGQVIEWSEDGKPLRMIGTHLDISERKRSEHKLATLNQRLSLARDAAGMGIWEVDLSTGHLDWDDGMYRLYGLDESEFHNQVENWVSCLHPADREHATNEFKNSVSERRNFDSEFRIISHPDGLRYIQANAQIVTDDDGNAERVIGANYDITALRQQQQQAERALSLIEASLEATDNGVLVTGANGRILRWNHRLLEMWRLLPEQIKNKTHKQLLQHIVPQLQNSQGVSQQMQELYANPQQGAFDLLECADGRVFERSSLPMMIEQQAIGRVWNYRDITSQQRSQKALIEARQQAESALVAKSQFLASMSHEIRTPMNGILGMLELLRSTPLTEEQQHRVSLARSSAQSLLSLINDILDFSKIEAQKLTLVNERYDFLAMVGDCVEGLAQLAQDKDVELILDTSAAECQYLLGDEGRSRQILTNLLGNAIKFTEAGEVEVSIKTSPADARPGRVELTIRDTGIGIPKDAQAQLFDAFSQVDASHSRRFGGTGLGLAIVRQLLQLMQGDIYVDSEPGRGSVFTAYWYVNETWPRQNPPQPQRQVLIVASHPRLAESISAMLCHLNASTTACLDVAQAMALAQPGSFDTILIDHSLALAENNSGQLVSTPLKQQAQCRLVMLTPMHFHSEPDALSQAGIDWWFPKPVTEQDLLRALDKHASSRWHQRDSFTGQGGWQHLLLVEDNQVNQLVASELLSAMGYRVSIADNGRHALSFLQHMSDPVELILMDCQMPDMDGYEATRRIRAGEAGQDVAKLPIIAMTANAMEGDKQICLEAGMDDYLSKPVNLQAVQQKLHQWLQAPADAQPPTPSALEPTQTSDAQPNTDSEASMDQGDVNQTEVNPGADAIEPIWLSDEALQRMMGNETLLKRLLDLFLQEQPGRIEALKQSQQQGNGPAISAEAHTIKGAAANLGAEQVRRLAEQLEHSSRAEPDADHMPTITELEQAVERFKQHVSPAQQAPEPTSAASEQLTSEHLSQLRKLQAELELANYIDSSDYSVLQIELAEPELAQQLQNIRQAVDRFDGETAKAQLRAVLERFS
jgi:PAS domain S-box-containing protein